MEAAVEVKAYCNVCHKTFTNNHVLRRHISSIHVGNGSENSRIECNLCKKTLNTKSYSYHTKNVHGECELIHSCRKCPKSFQNKQGLKQHYKTTHENIDRKECSKCDLTFVDERTLKKHDKESHRDFRIFCQDCGTSLKNERSLKSHIEIVHKKLKRYKCDRCEKTFSQKHSLNSHINYIHNKTKPFKCELCDKAFSEKAKVKLHHDTFHQDIARKYQCDICNFRFFYPHKLKLHYRDVHEKIRVNCTLCKKPYNKSNLATHMKLKHKESDFSLFRCKVCEKDLRSKQSLNQHQATEHDLKTANINHKCDICNKQFTQRTHLRTHMKGVHYHKRNIKCSICVKTFDSNDGLKSHMTTNHGADPQFMCKYCDTFFNNSSARTLHVKTTHKEHFFQCNKCEQKFKYLNSYQYHVTHVHNDFKQFHCNVCKIFFKSKRGLSMHEAKHPSL